MQCMKLETRNKLYFADDNVQEITLKRSCSNLEKIYIDIFFVHLREKMMDDCQCKCQYNHIMESKEFR